MHWNHRVVRSTYSLVGGGEEAVFAIHEVYYDDAGKPESLTLKPVSPQGETVEELKSELLLFCGALAKPVLEYDDFS